MRRTLVWTLLLLLLSAASAGAQTAVVTTQSGNTANSSAQATGAAVAKTLVASSRTRAHLYSFDAVCSAGSATVTITDGATTIWQSPSAFIGTTLVTRTWQPGLTGTLGATMTVTLGTCGGSNVGTLSVQADIF